MKKIYIIGGGLAGLTAAIRLATNDCKVFIFEKTTYPRHKVCGEYISMEVFDFLSREDLLPQDINTPHINKLLLTSATGRSTHHPLVLGGLGISRYHFENFLYKKALTSGVNFIHDEVTSIKKDGKYHLLKTKSGDTYNCGLVLGAYGKRSNLDRQLNRAFFQKNSPFVGIKFHAHIKNHEQDKIALHNFPGGYCGICNVENDITNFCYLVEREKLREAGSIEHLEEHYLFENPLLKEALLNAERIYDKPLVINEISFETKGPIELGMIMMGDAAGMIAPLCGNGMAMAIHSAKLASDIIIEMTTFNSEDILNEYQRQWNTAFKARLAFGRLVQRYLFGKNWSSEIAISLGNTLPGFTQFLINKTHGKPI